VEGLRLLTHAEPDRGSTLLRITPLDEDHPEQSSTVEGLTVVGNECLSGGTIDIFLEAMLPPTLVHVFGGAPIARSLESVATAAGYAVTATTDPGAAIAPDTAAVVVASHGRDEPAVLAQALKAGVPYVGLIASRKRGRAVLAELDLPDDLRQRVHTPAGLDIGARTALEIAVSVVAELISVHTVPRPAPEPSTLERSSALTAIDPVCGMSVAAVPASLHVEHDGRTIYFCGPGCRQAFSDNPEGYSA
jgi:xanthine dehydrogenase accessory factor